MKLKIWDKETVKNSSTDQLFLRLMKGRVNEDITLSVCDHMGTVIKDGHMLVIDQDLKGLILLRSLSEKIPLKTDMDGIPLLLTEEQVQRLHERDMKVKAVTTLIENMQQKEKELSAHH